MGLGAPRLSSLRYLRALIAVLVSLCSERVVIALDPNYLLTQYRQSTWNRLNGMPQGSALTLTQSADGYIWIGTQRGLVRFDGSKFAVAAQDNLDLSEQPVNALKASRAGVLWAATAKGIYQIRGLNDVKLVPPAKQELRCGRGVSEFSEDENGGILAGSLNGRVCRWASGTWVEVGPKENRDAVKALLRARDGALWIGTVMY